MKTGRIVYSTGTGNLCLGCGWPADDCRCSERTQEPVPSRIHARLRLEKKGHAGKSVTVVEGLPRNAPFLSALAAELKKACGTGGRPGETSVELQGDQRERLRALLTEKGWQVKG